MLGATLPHVDAWNAWYTRFGNTPEGFAAESAGITDAADRAGRAPSDIERSACLLVATDPKEAGARPMEVPPLPSDPPRLASRLREFSDAGADEAILVLSPTTEASIAAIAGALDLLDG